MSAETDWGAPALMEEEGGRLSYCHYPPLMGGLEEEGGRRTGGCLRRRGDAPTQAPTPYHHAYLVSSAPSPSSFPVTTAQATQIQMAKIGHA